MIRIRLAALLLTAALALAACGGDDDGSGGAATATPSAAGTQVAACDKSTLDLKTPGQLTVATDKPAFPPYFVDNDPANGKGFESAVAYAVADQLGFDRSEVKWT